MPRRHALVALLALSHALASSDRLPPPSDQRRLGEQQPLEWKVPRDRNELHRMSTQIKEKLGYIGSNFLGGAKKLAHGLVSAAVPIGPLPSPTLMIKEHTAMAEWWCATPNHSETYACKKKAFSERLRSAPSAAERQKLLKEQPKKPTDPAGQRQAVEEVQTMMRQYCNKVAAAQDTSLCKTSRSQEVLNRKSISALLAGVVNSTRHRIVSMSSTRSAQPPRLGHPRPASPAGLDSESHA